MSDTTAPPAGKKLDPKKIKIIGGVGLALAAYLYYRNRQSAAAAAATPATTTDTGMGTLTDTGPGAYGTQYSASSNSTVGNVTTNADWYQAALTAVEDAGYDSATAATALSAYLGAQPLTAAQQTIVRIGIAAAGSPPVGTFTIITAPTGTTGGGTTVPATVWPAPTRLIGNGRSATTMGLQWNASLVGGQPPPNGSAVRVLDSHGHEVSVGQTPETSYTVAGLRPNTVYYFEVWPGGVTPANKHAGITLWTARK